MSNQNFWRKLQLRAFFSPVVRYCPSSDKNIDKDTEKMEPISEHCGYQIVKGCHKQVLNYIHDAKFFFTKWLEMIRHY